MQLLCAAGNGRRNMRHPLDANARAADEHYDQPDAIGHEDGETCNRDEIADMLNEPHLEKLARMRRDMNGE